MSLGACRNSFFRVFFLLLAKFSFQSSFFSESRSFSRPLFCFFVLNLDPLAGQPIQIFFCFFSLFQIFFRYTIYSYVAFIYHTSSLVVRLGLMLWLTHTSLVAIAHVQRNPNRRMKRQKKSIFIYGTTL